MKKIIQTWQMYVNFKVSAEQPSFVKSLKGNTSIKGLTEIIHMIFNDLYSSNHRKLGRFLGIKKEIFAQDYLVKLIDDLLKRKGLEKSQLASYDKKKLIPI